mmetsp:Transcript_36464/g.117511  ORF Transcript_36464/g.117511 Transcript_36464/m.117511 type:complete len:274 (+) Transcript_36464:679-1500(+)
MSVAFATAISAATPQISIRSEVPRIVGNCKAYILRDVTGGNSYTTLAAATAACDQNDRCEAVYKMNGQQMFQQRRTCCDLSPRPSWCTDDQRCSLQGAAAATDGSPICNRQQGGITYYKPITTNRVVKKPPGMSPPASPLPALASPTAMSSSPPPRGAAETLSPATPTGASSASPSYVALMQQLDSAASTTVPVPVEIILLTVLPCTASLTAAIGCLCGYYCWRKQRGSEERVRLRAEEGVVPIAPADEDAADSEEHGVNSLASKVANVFAKG